MPVCPLVDCHTHTSFSDGHASFEDNVRAAAAARDVCARGRLPILAGGTGLYIELLLSGGPAPSAPAACLPR